MTCVEFAAVVDAYVDRELSHEDRTAADAHAAGCAACLRLAQDRLELSRVIAVIPYRQAPSRLRTQVISRTRPRYGVARRVFPLAAGMAAVLALGATGVAVRSVERSRAEAATTRLAEGAVDAHVRILESGRLFDIASSDQHTVKPWFLGKIDFAPPVEDLASAGFPLAGGRVDALDSQPEAALIYMRRLHPIDVFIRPSSASSGVDARTLRGFQVRHWTAREMSFWVVSDLGGAELDDFVTELRRVIG